MERIDIYPIRQYKGFSIGYGRVLPFGATLVNGGVNFSVFSKASKACWLVLYNKGETEPLAEIPFTEDFRLGDVYSMVVFGLDYEQIEYGYRMEGVNDVSSGMLFDRTKLLLDPYAKAISGRAVWGAADAAEVRPQYRSKIIADDYDWEGDKPLELRMEDLIIYECHVRGFTKSASSGVRHPGTFSGFREKIPYLKELGINCVELMPVYEFDEFENYKAPEADRGALYNYWGYSSVGFFAPKAGLAAGGSEDLQVDEFKYLIKSLHKNGIEVILDVVFNHTAEGNEKGPYISFRGIDNQIYYMLTPRGEYYNFSGCGNTVNCNHPVVRSMILDCLRYWASEYHVDGFRFDLASILGRNQDGTPMKNPPLLEALAFDPVLSRCKLIAEAWDAGGLYQVGNFPSWGHFAEWNGKYRNIIRKFIKGDRGCTGEAVTRILGSSDMYAENGLGVNASVNFINCHDGFTLMDMVSYNYKHNEQNGEGNRDGSDDNCSWNCGAEGETTDEGVIRLRIRQIKNAFTILMLSQGVPMFLAGDEMGNTQFGNNNAYCQDNEISWLDWSSLKKNKEIFDYVKNIIRFRHTHNELKRTEHLQGNAIGDCGKPDVSMHGVLPWKPDYTGRVIGIMYAGADEDIYLAMNMHWEAHEFRLPEFVDGRRWHLAADTFSEEGGDFYGLGNEPELDDTIKVRERSVQVLVRRRTD